MAEFAGAVFGFVQIGFSLTSTLTTYIADVKDAPEDVANLANEVDATLRQVEELDKLLFSNDRTKGWNENGVKLAEKCRLNSEQIVSKLLKILQKSKSTVPPGHLISRGDIDLSVFSKASWPLMKPRLEVIKAELARTKIDILLARDLYNASAGGSQSERQAARDRIAGLARSKGLAIKRLHRAKAETRARRPAQRLRFAEPSRSPQAHQRRKPSSDECIDYDSDYDSATYSDTDSITPSVYDDWEQLFRKEFQEESARKAEELEKLSALKATAVAVYKQELLKDLAVHQQEVAEAKARLSTAFDPPVPQDQIARYIDQEQARLMSDEMKTLVARLNIGRPQYEPSEFANASAASSSNSKRSLVSRLFKGSKTRLSEHTRQGTPVPLALQRTAAPADFPQTLSITVAFDGRQNWHVMPIHIPISWLIKQLAEEERSSRSKKGRTRSIQIFSNLPYSCRVEVNNWLERHSDRRQSWALIFADCDEENEAKSRGMVQRTLMGSVVETHLKSILLVFRATQHIDQYNCATVNAKPLGKFAGGALDHGIVVGNETGTTIADSGSMRVNVPDARPVETQPQPHEPKHPPPLGARPIATEPVDEYAPQSDSYSRVDWRERSRSRTTPFEPSPPTHDPQYRSRAYRPGVMDYYDGASPWTSNDAASFSPYRDDINLTQNRSRSDDNYWSLRGSAWQDHYRPSPYMPRDSFAPFVDDYPSYHQSSVRSAPSRSHSSYPRGTTIVPDYSRPPIVIHEAYPDWNASERERAWSPIRSDADRRHADNLHLVRDRHGSTSRKKTRRSVSRAKYNTIEDDPTAKLHYSEARIERYPTLLPTTHTRSNSRRTSQERDELLDRELRKERDTLRQLEEQQTKERLQRVFYNDGGDKTEEKIRVVKWSQKSPHPGDPKDGPQAGGSRDASYASTLSDSDSDSPFSRDINTLDDNALSAKMVEQYGSPHHQMASTSQPSSKETNAPTMEERKIKPGRRLSDISEDSRDGDSAHAGSASSDPLEMDV